MKESILTSTFMRLRGHLRTLAAGITGNEQDAEDALHDAFCKLWTAHKALEDEVQASKLAYAAVRNTAIDSFRRTRNHPAVTIDENAGLPSDDSLGERQEQEEAYNHALDTARRILNDRQYEIFMLHDVNNLPYSEISKRLELTEDNIRVILSRARKALRSELFRTSYEN